MRKTIFRRRSGATLRLEVSGPRRHGASTDFLGPGSRKVMSLLDRGQDFYPPPWGRAPWGRRLPSASRPGDGDSIRLFGAPEGPGAAHRGASAANAAPRRRSACRKFAGIRGLARDSRFQNPPVWSLVTRCTIRRIPQIGPVVSPLSLCVRRRGPERPPEPVGTRSRARRQPLAWLAYPDVSVRLPEREYGKHRNDAAAEDLVASRGSVFRQGWTGYVRLVPRLLPREDKPLAALRRRQGRMRR
jgi:hypothetical protein